MKSIRPLLSSVTRWLLMVVGCAVLEAAQPMSAAAEHAGALAGDTVIYPAGAATSSAATPATGGGTWVFVTLVFLATGAFYFWRKRHATPSGRRPAGLIVEETRALGNRQFLLVAACDGKRFLLGVAPGSIRMLAPLDEKEPNDSRTAP